MTTAIRKAEIKAAARELLRLSHSLNADGLTIGGEVLLPSHHVIHCATALASLCTGDITRWSNYTELVRETAAEEVQS